MVQKYHNVEAKIWLQSKEHKKTEYPRSKLMGYRYLKKVYVRAKFVHNHSFTKLTYLKLILIFYLYTKKEKIFVCICRVYAKPIFFKNY